MRKGFSIFFVVLMLLSAARVTISTHYCHGKVAATKVTMSGKLASCGMEKTEKNIPLPGSYLTSLCCTDNVTTIGTCNIFTSSFSSFTANVEHLRLIYYVPVIQSFHSDIISNNFYTSISPPGKLVTTAVKLDDICEFRI
jgi:hypothetical protein